jgi:hypothetical protein
MGAGRLAAMERSAGMGALVRRMEGLLGPLEASGDPGRFFLATYLRTTRAVAEELERGGFRDPAWVERWDVAFADLYLDAVEDAQAGRRPPEPWAVAFGAGLEAVGGPRSRTDRLLQPLNRLAAKRFLRESRAKVWANARLLDHARRAGPGAYAARLAELERLAATRVADLMASGQVVLKLAVKGFGVRLPAA